MTFYNFWHRLWEKSNMRGLIIILLAASTSASGQSIYDSQKEPDFFTFTNLVNIGIIITVSILITRAVLSIPKILRFYKAQTILLAKIAEKHGVPEHEIDNVLSEVEDGIKWKVNQN